MLYLSFLCTEYTSNITYENGCAAAFIISGFHELVNMSIYIIKHFYNLLRACPNCRIDVIPYIRC